MFKKEEKLQKLFEMMNDFQVLTGEQNIVKAALHVSKIGDFLEEIWEDGYKECAGLFEDAKKSSQ